MIEVRCCSKPRSVPESAIGRRVRCPACSQVFQPVSAEPLAPGAGAGDFDASFTVVKGPPMHGVRLLLGGLADITIGRAPQRQIQLTGAGVSDLHCRLQRLDFGPSRWKIIDNQSATGLFVNRHRVAERELADGDLVAIGGCELKYAAAPPVPIDLSDEAPAGTAPDRALGPAHAPAPLELPPVESLPSVAPLPRPGIDPGAVRPPPPVCPCCHRTLAPRAKICTDCGIYVPSGRPLLTSQGVDEDSIYESAKYWIFIVSWIIPITPFPIPIRSEAFGTRKPLAIWTIALMTVLASVAFYFAQNSADPGSSSNFMLWPGAKFHVYQLLTSAFIHDPNSILGFLLHLLGNLLFLLVFGSRVNALLGNLATFILYPLLAVCANLAQLAGQGTFDPRPSLGASGAIMGLAGIYLVLLPAHRVFCAMWVNVWVYIRWYYFYKVFPMRGYAVLLFYLAFDLAVQAIERGLGLAGSVAHWAHIGGFLTGVALGLALLLSRRFNTHGGDLLSMTLGRRAWALIGKPNQWARPASGS